MPITTRQMYKNRLNAKRQKLSNGVAPVVKPISIPIVSRSTQTTRIQWNPYVLYLLNSMLYPRCTKGKMARFMDPVLFQDRIESIMTDETSQDEIEIIKSMSQPETTLEHIMANAFITVALIIHDEMPELITKDVIKAFGTEVETTFKVRWEMELVPFLLELFPFHF